MHQIEFERDYKTGILAISELHAGGVLFYSLYKLCLKFSNSNTFKYWIEIVDEGLPLDDEIEILLSKNYEGTYQVNSRGYLEFEINELNYTCKNSESIPNVLVASIWKKEGFASSLVFIKEANANT